jgi:hypothetical protein
LNDIFSNRHEAFRFGYAAFHDGYLNNFYDPNKSDEDFWKNREWQAGFDVAFNETRQYWDSRDKSPR